MVGLCVKASPTAQKCRSGRSLTLFPQLIPSSSYISSGAASDLNTTEHHRIRDTRTRKMWSSLIKRNKILRFGQKPEAVQQSETGQDFLNLKCVAEFVVHSWLAVAELFATNPPKERQEP